MGIGRMKKDFIVSRIEAAQDGSTNVYVTVRDRNDNKSSGAGERQQQNPFGSNVFASPEDLMKNLPNAMRDISKMMGTAAGGGVGMQTDSPTFKMSMNEYEDMAIKVGDKLTIEVTKPAISGT